MSWGRGSRASARGRSSHAWSAGMLLKLRFMKTIFGALLWAAMLTTAVPAVAQNPGVSPVLQLRSGAVNKTRIYKNSTVIVQMPARIAKILDFDPLVVKIDPVQGHPDQFALFGLETGVSTVTLIDEFDAATKIEVLVEGDVRHLETTLHRVFPDDDIIVTEIKGSVLLTGWVSRPEHINQIVEVAEQFFPLVLNQMRIGGNQQVSLKATVMEVNRTKLRQMGMNFGLVRSDSFLLSTPGPITPIGGLTVTNTSATPSFSGFQNASVTFGFMNPSSIFQGFVDALRTEGLLKIHATPMVTTHNGSPAELLNGGEAPVLVPAGLGTTAIEFKPFGIILNAVPHLLGNGRVRLQVEPSVVERDFANSVTVDGITVPSFTTRKVSTEVEMNMGQTLVIGGLVSKRNAGGTTKVPFFGELPWVGAAFSRKDYSEVETELVILVTPNFASAMSDEQIPPGGPGLFTDTPTDVELFGQGLLEVPLVGPECSGKWNCMECDRNGSCVRHPYGRIGSDNCTNCGPDGCTDNRPGLVSPIQISPGAPLTRSGTPGTPQLNLEQTSPRTADEAPGRATLSGARQANRPQTTPSGLISPLMR